MICRVLVESGFSFDSPTHILVLDEVGEFVWPSIRVVILADMGFRVAVLTGDGCPCDGGSSSGRRLRGCMTRLIEWNFVVDPPCQPFESSVSSSLAIILLVADLELVVVVLLYGGCLGGGGSLNGR